MTRTTQSGFGSVSGYGGCGGQLSGGTVNLAIPNLIKLRLESTTIRVPAIKALPMLATQALLYHRLLVILSVTLRVLVCTSDSFTTWILFWAVLRT